ncbi:hypothetical protein GGF46_001504 [Coemansia sp. RSA 552]|nr:hypothetical protein GGF46_001504 [Coemansia sp. RSA 552]
MSRSLYWFRNVRTRQVLTSTEKSVLARPYLLKSQIPAALQPSSIRPDHWRPMVVATGFETEQAQLDTFTLASQSGFPLVPQTKDERRKYLLLPNIKKRLIDKDMVERQVAQLARTLVYMDAVKSAAIPVQAPLTLLWDNREWIDKVTQAGLAWPEWVRHADLDIKRGAIIMNPELRSAAAAPTTA